MRPILIVIRKIPRFASASFRSHLRLVQVIIRPMLPIIPNSPSHPADPLDPVILSKFFGPSYTHIDSIALTRNWLCFAVFNFHRPVLHAYWFYSLYAKMGSFCNSRGDTPTPLLVEDSIDQKMTVMHNADGNDT